MKTLRFIVDNYTITKDPACDFSGLTQGKENAVKAEFVFSANWKGYRKAVAFYRLGKELPARLLEDGRSCYIPTEALEKRTFWIEVVGKKKSSVIKTNRVQVVQDAA